MHFDGWLGNLRGFVTARRGLVGRAGEAHGRAQRQLTGARNKPVKSESGRPRMGEEFLRRGMRVSKRRVRQATQTHGIQARRAGSLSS